MFTMRVAAAPDAAPSPTQQPPPSSATAAAGLGDTRGPVGIRELRWEGASCVSGAARNAAGGRTRASAASRRHSRRNSPAQRQSRDAARATRATDPDQAEAGDPDLELSRVAPSPAASSFALPPAGDGASGPWCSSTSPAAEAVAAAASAAEVVEGESVRMVHIAASSSCSRARGGAAAGGVPPHHQRRPPLRRAMTPLGDGAMVAPIHRVPGLESGALPSINAWPAPVSRTAGSGQPPRTSGLESPRRTGGSPAAAKSDAGDARSLEARVTDPVALRELTQFAAAELKMVSPGDARGRLRVFSELFDRIICCFTTFAPLLSQVRDAYNSVLRGQDAAIEAHLLGDQALQHERERYLTLQQECVATMERERAAAEQHRQRLVEAEHEHRHEVEQLRQQIAAHEQQIAELQKRTVMEETVRREADENLNTYITLYNELKAKWGAAREEVVEYKAAINDRMTYLETAERCAIQEAAALRERLAETKRAGDEKYAALRASTVEPELHRTNVEQTKKLQAHIRALEKKIEWMQRELDARAHFEPPIPWKELSLEFHKLRSSGNKSSEDVVRIMLLRLHRAQKAERHVAAHLAAFYTMREFLSATDISHVMAAAIRDGTAALVDEAAAANGTTTTTTTTVASPSRRLAPSPHHLPLSAVRFLLSPLVADLGAPPATFTTGAAVPSRSRGGPASSGSSGSVSIALAAAFNAPTVRTLTRRSAPWAPASWCDESMEECANHRLSHSLVKGLCVAAFVGLTSFSFPSLAEGLDSVASDHYDFSTRATFFASFVHACERVFVGDPFIALFLSGLRGDLPPIAHYSVAFVNINIRLLHAALEKTERCFAASGKLSGCLPRRVLVEAVQATLPHKTPRQLIRLKHALFRMFPLHVGRNVYYRDLHGPYAAGTPSLFLVELCDQFADEVAYFTALVGHALNAEAREHHEEGMLTPYLAKIALHERLPRILAAPRQGELEQSSSGTASAAAEQQQSGGAGDSGGGVKRVSIAPHHIAAATEGEPPGPGTAGICPGTHESTHHHARHALQTATQGVSTSTVSAPLPLPIVKMWVAAGVIGELGIRQLGAAAVAYQPLSLPRVPIVEDSTREVCGPPPALSGSLGGGGGGAGNAATYVSSQQQQQPQQQLGGLSRAASVANLIRKQSIASLLSAAAEPAGGGRGGGAEDAASLILSMIQPAPSALDYARSVEQAKRGRRKGGVPPSEEEAHLRDPTKRNTNDILAAMVTSNAAACARSLEGTAAIATNAALEVDVFLQNLRRTVAIIPMAHVAPLSEAQWRDLDASMYDDPALADAAAAEMADGDAAAAAASAAGGGGVVGRGSASPTEGRGATEGKHPSPPKKGATSAVSVQKK